MSGKEDNGKREIRNQIVTKDQLEEKQEEKAGEQETTNQVF
jgi:hypothetical protein